MESRTVSRRSGHPATQMERRMLLIASFLFCICGIPNSQFSIQAFSIAPSRIRLPLQQQSSSSSSSSSWTETVTALSVAGSAPTETSTRSANNEEEDADDDMYEYVEYEALTEAEFVKSEWLVGTCWDNNNNKIDETWVRLITDDNGKNVAYWGDKSEGKWSVDVASQFLSISKESIFGKQIWAGVVTDYYFLQGTVRGWNFWQAASVVAQWQAKRLGVDKEEAGVAPWFEENEKEEPTK